MSHRDLDRLFALFCRTGDLDALAAVFRIAAPALLRRARRRTGDAAAAEDIVQELFLSLLQGSARYDGARSSLPFLLGALQRHIDKWLRRRRGELREQLEGLDRADPARLTIAREELARVRAAIEALPATCRHVVADYLERQLTPTEIARRSGQRSGTVRVQIHRGLAQLRRALPGVPLLALVALLDRGVAAATPQDLPRLPVRRVLLATAAVVMTTIAVAVVAAPRTHANSAATAHPERVQAVAAATTTSTPTTPAPSPRVDVPAVAAHLEVSVADADGNAVPAVGVRAYRAGTDPDHTAIDGATSDDGRWQIAALPPGEWTVQIDRDQEQRVRIDRDDAAVRFAVDGGATVRGVVRDAAGLPVAGADIWVSHRPRHPWDGQVVAHADGDGRFELRNMPAMSTVAALARGHVAAPAQAVGPRPHRAMELRLGDRGARLEGEVADGDGPLAHAVVHVGSKPRAAYAIAGGEQIASIQPGIARRTDAAGHFAVDDLPPGPIEVLVRAPGHCDAIAAVRLTADATQRVRMVVCPGVDLAGVVTADDGAPLPQASVLARGTTPRRWSAADTDRDGTFSLCGLDPARIELSVEADGFAPQQLVVADPTHPIAVALQRLPRLQGVLCTADGVPVRDGEWQLGVRTGPPRALAQPTELPLDTNARFAACAPEPGDVRFFARRIGTAIWNACRVDRSDAQWRLCLPADCDELATIRLEREGFARDQLLDFQLFLERDEDVYCVAADDPESQTFVLPPLPIGRWHLHVFGGRGECPPIDLGDVDLPHNGVDLAVHPPACGYLRWDIGSVDPVAVEQFRAFLTGPAGQQVPLQRAAGRTALPCGEWRLWASSLVFAAVHGEPVQIHAGEETALSLRLPRAHMRQLAFWLPRGLDPTNCRAQLSCNDTVVLGAAAEYPNADLSDCGFDCGPDGFCTIVLALADGHYRLVVTSDNGQGDHAAEFDAAGPGTDAEPLLLTLAPTLASAR